VVPPDGTGSILTILGIGWDWLEGEEFQNNSAASHLDNLILDRCVERIQFVDHNTAATTLRLSLRGIEHDAPPTSHTMLPAHADEMTISHARDCEAD
jgi:hypothetical protein